MERTISATQARIHLGELMRQVRDEQQTVIVERNGDPQVVIVSLAAYQRMKEAEAQQLSTRERIEHVRAQITADLAGRPLPSFVELLQELRDERDDHLLDLR